MTVCESTMPARYVSYFRDSAITLFDGLLILMLHDMVSGEYCTYIPILPIGNRTRNPNLALPASRGLKLQNVSPTKLTIRILDKSLS